MSPDPSDDHAALARRLLREAGTAALATLADDGAPYASHVAVATDTGGAPVLLLSQLALHTQYLTRDARASLLVVDAAGDGDDPTATARLSVTGRLSATTDEAARRRYLARDPGAEGYAGFKDFAFYRLAIERAHLVAGFGRIVDLTPADLIDPA